MRDYSRAIKAVAGDIDPIERSFAEFRQQIADPSLKSEIIEAANQIRILVEQQLESLKMLEKFEPSLSETMRRAVKEKGVSAEVPATTAPPIAPST